MFWKFNLMTTSHIDTLLDKEDVTLHELMDEDDILQECKAPNRKLVNFLVTNENMEELVRLITEEPGEDTEEKLRYKYPNTACELLTSDVSQINDALAGNEDLVKKLYAFLDTEKELNPLLASFFSKVMGLLIARKSEMILEFLQTRDDFVGILLRHIGTSAIMDLLLRLLTCIESPEVRRQMIEWLNEKGIVQKLVTCITTAYDDDIHCNAAQSLTDIIRLGREQVIQLQDRVEPDPLLATVEKEENVSKLLDNMLVGEKNESVIVNGLSVIQTLLEFKKQGPEDSVEQMTSMDAEQMFHGMNNVLTAICPRLKEFHSILTEPPKQRFNVMANTVGLMDPPLGNTRLQIARLLASILLTNTHSINAELARLGTINVLIDLYFRYVWNNFLHAHVNQCLYTILNNPPIEIEGNKECPLLNQIITDCKLLQRILEEWDLNDEEQKKERGKRKGFMGHLTRLANDIVNAQEKGENTELIKSLVSELPEELKDRWEEYKTGKLEEINKKNTVVMDLFGPIRPDTPPTPPIGDCLKILVQGHNLASSSEDDDADFSNIPFPQDTAMQQAFSDYQLQQMTSNFIDQFGFNEDEFEEQGEKTDSPFTDRISSIDFGGSVNEDLRQNVSQFEQYCNERLQQFDDSDEDIWEEKEITFSPNTQAHKRSERLPVTRGSNDSDNSTDSDEDLDSPRRITQQAPAPGEKMDVDSNEAWTANFEAEGSVATTTVASGASSSEAEPIAMDTSPWDNNNTVSTGEKPPQAAGSSDWADFNKTPEKPAQEAWADFSNKVPEKADPAAKDKDTWADFTNFDNIEKSDSSQQRSSSPVAMDTTEPNSRTNAYLAKESDLKLESVDASVDADLGTDVDSLVPQSSGSPREPAQATTSDLSSPSPQSTSSPDRTAVATEPDSTTAEKSPAHSSQDVNMAESAAAASKNPASAESSSTTDANGTTAESSGQSSTVTSASAPSERPPTPPTSPVPEMAGQSSSCRAAPESPRSSPASNTDTNAQGDGCNAALSEGTGDEEEDLGSNFNFLTKVGLMKGAGSNCTATTASPVQGQAIQGNGPTNDTPDSTTEKVEELRSQAKDALESFDTATKTGANLQNGPV